LIASNFNSKINIEVQHNVEHQAHGRDSSSNRDKNKMLCLALVAFLFPNAFACKLYMVQSTNSYASSLLSGSSWKSDLELEMGSTIIVPTAEIMNWQLRHYAINFDLNYSFVMFNIAQVSQQRSQTSISVSLTSKIIPTQVVQSLYSQPITQSPLVKSISVKDINPEEEIFNDFEYSTSRVVASDDVIHSRPQSKQSKRHCLLNTFLAESKLEMAGKGVFADKSFHIDEIVSVTPVVLLPYHEVASARDSSLLLNYCFHSPSSDIALLPLTHMAMVNHGGRKANVKISWFEWSNAAEEPSRITTWPLRHLSELPYASLYLKYTAIRPISQGEEILLNYGDDWAFNWKLYLENLSEWASVGFGVDNEILMKPQFRHAIEVPDGMYPPHFYEECLGDGIRNASSGGECYNMELTRVKAAEREDVERAMRYARDNHYRTREKTSTIWQVEVNEEVAG
jgi:hypothetical protein